MLLWQQDHLRECRSLKIAHEKKKASGVVHVANSRCCIEELGRGIWLFVCIIPRYVYKSTRRPDSASLVLRFRFFQAAAGTRKTVTAFAQQTSYVRLLKPKPRSLRKFFRGHTCFHAPTIASCMRSARAQEEARAQGTSCVKWPTAVEAMRCCSYVLGCMMRLPLHCTPRCVFLDACEASQ